MVLKENATGALLANLPSELIAGDAMRGAKMPVLTGQLIDGMPGGPVFRAIKKGTGDNAYYWGHGNYYTPWDGQPLWYDTWD